MKIDFTDVLAALGYCYFLMVTVTNCGNRLQLLEITFSDDLSANGYTTTILDQFSLLQLF